MFRRETERFPAKFQENIIILGMLPWLLRIMHPLNCYDDFQNLLFMVSFSGTIPYALFRNLIQRLTTATIPSMFQDMLSFFQTQIMSRLCIGFISGLNLPTTSTFYAAYWVSYIQSMITFTSVGAKILATIYALGLSSHVFESIKTLYHMYSTNALKLVNDLCELYGTVTSLREGKDCRFRPTASRIRDSFEDVNQVLNSDSLPDGMFIKSFLFSHPRSAS